MNRKCIRLREYTSKLTGKCEEWATSYRDIAKNLKQVKLEKEELVSKVEALTSELKAIQAVDNAIDRSYNNDCADCKYLRKAIVNEGKRNKELQNELKSKENPGISLKVNLKSYDKLIEDEEIKARSMKTTTHGSKQSQSKNMVRDVEHSVSTKTYHVQAQKSTSSILSPAELSKLTNMQRKERRKGKQIGISGNRHNTV